MVEPSNLDAIEVPLSILAPAKLVKQASAEACGLFFPHGSHLPMCLAVDWDGETHLIHLGGAYAYQEGGLDIGHPIRGAVITQIEYRVDIASRYKLGEAWDPAGALLIKNGELHLFCSRLGDQLHYDPHPVPLGKGYMPGTPDEGCGFKKWSIAILDHGRPKVLQSFEAHSTK